MFNFGSNLSLQKNKKQKIKTKNKKKKTEGNNESIKLIWNVYKKLKHFNVIVKYFFGVHIEQKSITTIRIQLKQIKTRAVNKMTI